MKSILLTALMVLVIATLALPAHGQTLPERIAAIKAQRARQAEAARPKPKLTPKAKNLQTLLYSKLSVNFDQTPSRDVFEYLKTALDINMVVRYLDDKIGHGIDPSTPITLEVENMQALELLSMVLEQCELSETVTWQLRKSILEVGTKDRLSTDASREIRTYPIESILFEPTKFTGAPRLGLEEVYRNQRYRRSNSNPGLTGSIGLGNSYSTSQNQSSKNQRAQEIVELIIQTIDPSGWEQNGGERASIRYFDGALIVSAPDYIHRQIDGYPSVPRPKQSLNPPAKKVP